MIRYRLLQSFVKINKHRLTEKDVKKWDYLMDALQRACTIEADWSRKKINASRPKEHSLVKINKHRLTEKDVKKWDYLMDALHRACTIEADWIRKKFTDDQCIA
ncbi:MAG: hypothetical protein M1826_005905 [Phylliscum demangeonii]|nr:MAG: hypothetical protein M1826_005905 [Phylliscum demangeonii]